MCYNTLQHYSDWGENVKYNIKTTENNLQQYISMLLAPKYNSLAITQACMRISMRLVFLQYTHENL